MLASVHITEASSVWINDAGYCSYYCGSTMPASVHIIEAPSGWINDAGYRSYYRGTTMLANVHIVAQASSVWLGRRCEYTDGMAVMNASFDGGGSGLVNGTVRASRILPTPCSCGLPT